jgi:hypothetical protein
VARPGHGAVFGEAEYLAQTLDQMHNADRLSLAAPPPSQEVPIPVSSRGVRCRLPLGESPNRSCRKRLTRRSTRWNDAVHRESPRENLPDLACGFPRLSVHFPCPPFGCGCPSASGWSWRDQ